MLRGKNIYDAMTGWAVITIALLTLLAKDFIIEIKRKYIANATNLVTVIEQVIYQKVNLFSSKVQHYHAQKLY